MSPAADVAGPGSLAASCGDRHGSAHAVCEESVRPGGLGPRCASMRIARLHARIRLFRRARYRVILWCKTWSTGHGPGIYRFTIKSL